MIVSVTLHAFSGTPAFCAKFIWGRSSHRARPQSVNRNRPTAGAYGSSRPVDVMS
jgi:hypothetical protein